MSASSRPGMQALWRVGIAGEAQQRLVVAGLVERYHDCLPEKNYTLICFDILQGLRQL
jgi:hypothetical protein